MARRGVRLILALLLLGVSRPAASDTTECFTDQSLEFDGAAPHPVVAGMTRIRITAGGATVAHDSFFDGFNQDDPFSERPNLLAGSVDCDQDPDVRIMWGYAFADATVNLGGRMELSVTRYFRGRPNLPGDCVETSNPVVRIVGVDTLTQTMSSLAGSLLFEANLTTCDDSHDYYQFRFRAVADTNLGPADVDEGCMVVPVQPVCPGWGPNCFG